VVLRKVRQFQEFGHTAILILGASPPSSATRPAGRSPDRPCRRAEVEEHARTYVEQVRQILLPEPLEVRRKLGVARHDGYRRRAPPQRARTTVARLLERDDFATAVPRGPTDLGQRVSLPAAPGLGLRDGPLRRRARRHRPALQQSDGQSTPRTGGPGGPGRPDAAPARRARRCPKDVEVARKLRRHHRTPPPSSSGS